MTTKRLSFSAIVQLSGKTATGIQVRKVELEGDAEARCAFESLSYSKKRGLVEPIDQAKKAETRQKRIEGARCAVRTRPLRKRYRSKRVIRAITMRFVPWLRSKTA